MQLDLATTSMLAGMMLNETPALNTLTPDEARLVFSEINRSMPPGPAQVSSRDVEIPVNGGSIRGRVLAPSTPCLLYTSPSPRDGLLSRMPSSA